MRVVEREQREVRGRVRAVVRRHVLEVMVEQDDLEPEVRALERKGAGEEGDGSTTLAGTRRDPGEHGERRGDQQPAEDEERVEDVGLGRAGGRPGRRVELEVEVRGDQHAEER